MFNSEFGKFYGANFFGLIMKKKLMLFLLSVCLPFMGFSQRSDVTVKAGDASVLMKNAKACVEFNYSNTMVGEFPSGGNRKDSEDFKNAQTLDAYLQQRGADYVKDWPDDHIKAELLFITAINRLSGKGGIVLDFTNPYEQSGTDYKILVNVDRLDMGNGAGAFVHAPMTFKTKSGGTIFQGTVEVINLSTGTAECVFDCPFVKGNPNPSETGRLQMMYHNLGTNIIKLVKDGAKNGGAVAASSSASTYQQPVVQQSPQPVNNNVNAPTIKNGNGAVSNPYDIVKLKNGSEIKGTIKEILPGQSVKLETSDGSTWVFKNAEIQEIVPSNQIIKVSLKNGSEIKGRITELKLGQSVKVETADGSSWVFKDLETNKIESTGTVSSVQNVSRNQGGNNVPAAAPQNMDNAIVKTIPSNFLVEDNIVVQNNLPFMIDEVIVYKQENGNFVPFPSMHNIKSGDNVTIAEFSNNELAQFRGKEIAVEVRSSSISNLKKDVDIKLYQLHDDLRIMVIPYGQDPFDRTKSKEQPKQSNSNDGVNDPTGDTGFKMYFGYLHGFDNGSHFDMFNFDFGANVISGLYVGAGPSAYVGGYDPFNWGIGGQLDVRYTAPFWSVRPYADFKFGYMYNFESELGFFETGWGVGVCLNKKILLGVHWLTTASNVDVEKKYYNGRRTYTKTEEEKVTSTATCIHFGLMF